MQLVDTHCHLDLKNFSKDVDEVVQRALDAGVIRMLVPGINLESSKRAVELSNKFEAVFAACGVHPHDADLVSSSTMGQIKRLCVENHKVVAIGEVGLDHYRNYSKHENQLSLIEESIKLALELNLPLIIHNREAEDDFIKVLDKFSKDKIRGVIHCFSGSRRFLKRVLENGFYVSFAGNITFKKAETTREMIKDVPIEKLLLETDSPYISPVPLRGKRNEPVNVKYLLDIYSSIYGLTCEDIARITTQNANHLFHLNIRDENRIAYQIRNSLYLNITNRCTNECVFCTRDLSDYVKGHNLKLEDDPSVDMIKESMGDISLYDEIVFCGFGEPTLRLNVIKEIASYAKQKGKKVRVVTNGSGNLINKRPIAQELKGLVDNVSVSLNAPDPDTYKDICKPVFGENTYNSIFDFIKDCIEAGILVEVTCLDFIGEEKVALCREKAEEYGAKFRLRHLNVVG